MTLPLPSPENYSSWQDYARALNSTLNELADASFGQQQGAYYDVTHILPDSLPIVPEGYGALWLSVADAKLFLANPAYDPPVAEDIVFIDTAAIADAAIKTSKIDNLAVVQVKIANAAVGTTKIANLAVTNALIALLAVGNAQISDLAVTTSKIGLAAIVTALIGDLQVTTGKVNDLAVNNAKIANLAVDSGKIANLSIGNAHIIDGAVDNAKIGNTIQSASWNSSTKAGWQIDKLGVIRGQGIEIYSPSGTLIFSSGGGLAVAWGSLTSRPSNLASLTGAEGILNNLITLTSAGGLVGAGGGSLDLSDIPGLIDYATQTTGFGALAALDILTLGVDPELQGFGTLAALNTLSRTGGLLSGFGTIAGESSLTLGGSFLSGFGSLAAVSLLNTGNISTYIAAAAIGAALIANLAVGTAAINDLAVTNAKIADATIGSAKIFDLVVDKLSSGQLDALIEVGDGIFSFVVGASALYLGNGFGDASQFFLWFGPSSVLVGDTTEASAIVYLKTNGDAYFGGALSAGTITNAGQSTLGTDTEFVLGPFTSAGHSCQINTTAIMTGILASDSSHTWTEIDGDTSSALADPYTSVRRTIRMTFVLAKSPDGASYTTIQTYSVDVSSASRKHLVSRVVTSGTVTETKYWEHYWHAVLSNTTTDTLSSGTEYLRMHRTVLMDTGTSGDPAGTWNTDQISIRSIEA